jgi:hypothetical protein
MRKTSVLISLGAVVLLASLAAGDEAKLIGKVKVVDVTKGEISVIMASSAVQVALGDKFYMLIDNKPVLITATFPMMSQTKCKLVPGYKDYIKKITVGAQVYKYTKDIDKKIDDTEMKSKGSVKELVMLCGNSFFSDNVKTYMAMLGDGSYPPAPNSSSLSNLFSGSQKNIEIYRHQYGYYYSYKKKGVSLKFDDTQNGFVLTEIILYNEASNGFSKYDQTLPENLTFSDTRSSVEKKIGKPKETGGEGMIPFWASYSHLGFIVTYKSMSITDMNNEIFFVTIKRFI